MIKDLWQDGKVGKLLAIIFVLCVASLISLPFIIYYDNLEMEIQQCKLTGESRDTFYIQNIYGANGLVIGSYPVPYTEFKYTCNDGYRWR